MADDHGHAEELCIGVSTLSTTDVWRSDDRTLKIRRLAQVVDEDHRGIEVIHRHVEEALDLVSVQVHSDDACDPCRAQQVCHELRPDRYTGLILTVLTSPSEVRDDRSDVVCGSTLSSIDHQEELHDVVRRGIGGLYEEDILTTDTVLVVDREFAVSEMLYLHITEVNTQGFGDLSSQFQRSRACEDGNVLCVDTHLTCKLIGAHHYGESFNCLCYA